MDSDCISGDFERLADGSMEGWCRSAQRPHDRLVVDLIADAQVVATVVADRFRRDLAREGKGDGCHGFRLEPGEIAIPAGASLLSLRERTSRRIFARARLGQRFARSDPRLDRIEEEIIAVRAHLADPRPTSRASDAVARGFGAIGHRLTSRRIGAIGAGEAMLARRSRLRDAAAFALAPTPAHTFVLWVRDAVAAVSVIDACRSRLSRGEAELIIADAGVDPDGALLAASFPNAGFVRARIPRSFAGTISDALAGARGGHVAVFDVAPGSTGATVPLDECFDRLSQGARIVVGPRPAFDVANIGLVGWGIAAHRIEAPVTSPFLCGLDSALIRTLGGFDPGLDTSPALAVLDYALKASMIGVRPVWLAPNRASDHGRGYALEPHASSAWTRMAHRWDLGTITSSLAAAHEHA